MPISAASLETSLRNTFEPTHLEIQDTSNGCGENYAVVIVSKVFEGKMTLARHRLVNELLKDEISQMHAFSQIPEPKELLRARRTSTQNLFDQYLINDDLSDPIIPALVINIVAREDITVASTSQVDKPK
ncbi:BolA IbaG family [Rhizoctonia solani]|uniref:BolA IbaG family n=1 Tax=Rhizoctonia solani TaxID=456999 RepID=A0A8H7LJE3_9AGAM|nr:BolA IbaG family [Rhizoctonia solani]